MATVIGTASAGKKLKGAIASAPVAPAASAIRRRRQPEARMIEMAIASMAGFLERSHDLYRDCAKAFRALPVRWTKPCTKAHSAEGYYPPPFAGGSPFLASSPRAGLYPLCF